MEYTCGKLWVHNMEIESDCLFAALHWSLFFFFFAWGVALVSEYKQLAMDFVKISFEHCFREANQAADELELSILLMLDLRVLGMM